jgi:isopenicillin-N N-acyltransferase like protein
VGHEFPLVRVEGSAREMGRQHGEQARALVKNHLGWIGHLTGQPLPLLCRNAERFLPAMEALSPRFVEEVRGLSEGADISLPEALLCQSRAEASHAWDRACTAFAFKGEATADGEIIIGQNQDLETEYSDIAIVLHVSPNDGRPRALMFTFAGQLGYSGINQFGFAHFANALYGFQWRPGLPHYPLKRVLLEQRTVEEGIEVLRAHSACSAANMILADGDGRIADVEVRPDGIAVYKDEHPDSRLHTNHYLCSEFVRFEDNFLPDSVPRLERMRTLVSKAWGTITPNTVKDFLADHDGDPAGICRHGGGNLHSVAGYIAEPAKKLLHIRRGHGCLGTWTTYQV